MGLTCWIKLGKFLYLIYLIFAVLYRFSCIDVGFYFLVHCTYFRFSNWRQSAILDFKMVAFLSKNQISAFFYTDLQNLAKIGRPAAELLCVFNFQYGGRRHL